MAKQCMLTKAATVEVILPRKTDDEQSQCGFDNNR